MDLALVALFLAHPPIHNPQGQWLPTWHMSPRPPPALSACLCPTPGGQVPAHQRGVFLMPSSHGLAFKTAGPPLVFRVLTLPCWAIFQERSAQSPRFRGARGWRQHIVCYAFSKTESYWKLEPGMLAPRPFTQNTCLLPSSPAEVLLALQGFTQSPWSL